MTIDSIPQNTHESQRHDGVYNGPLLTFICPIAPYHYDLEERVSETIKAQTVPCQFYTIHDTGMRGPGWARNRGLESVKSPYVSFIDTDDTLDPRFAEICLGVLARYAQSGKTDPRYAYTDWIDSLAHQAPSPCVAWTEHTSHLVTTVIPTHYARLIGGFDEALQGAEDADFYVRLRIAGLCGLHVEAPLVHYREGGQRSITARINGAESAAQHYMSTRYGGYNLMGCCGDNTQGPLMPDGEPNEGDVLVQAQWHGNMQKRGLATGTIYARTSYPKYLYVNEQDAALSPLLFKRVNSPLQAANGIVLQPAYKAEGVPWQDTVQGLFGAAPQPQAQLVEYKPRTAGKTKADVVTAAQVWTKIEGSEL